jgi:hypothetical protein
MAEVETILDKPRLLLRPVDTAEVVLAVPTLLVGVAVDVDEPLVVEEIPDAVERALVGTDVLIDEAVLLVKLVVAPELDTDEDDRDLKVLLC